MANAEGTPGKPQGEAQDSSGTLRPLGALSAEEVQDRLVNVILIAVVVLGFLGGVGAWAYQRLGESMREVRSAGLNGLLEAEVRIVMVWIEEKKRDSRRWASTPQLQAQAKRIAKMAAKGAAPAQTCASPAQRALSETLAPFAQYEELAAFNLIARDGTIIAAQHAALCGRRIASAEFMALLAPVFSGQTIFVRPWQEADRVGAVPDSPLQGSLVWVETPIRDEAGNVIAALGFGRLAEASFGRLLLLRMADSSREAYAFGMRGTMLSESRFQDDLKAAGIVAGSEQLAVRDPGGNLLAGFRPTTPPRDFPLTRLADSAIDGLRHGSLEGRILDPYRNYRGAEVIGAWRWLPQKELAVAVEIEAAEAYAPLLDLRRAFEVMFGFLFVSVLLAAAASVWAFRLRLREARRLGQYEITREIGEGGMSYVYLARHARLKRPTAVKVLKSFLANDEVIARFEREAQLCSQLTHPNTIDIYDYGRTRDGRFYYAMEYLRGISLEDLIAREGAMPVSRAVHLLRQACGSLTEAHARGLVHRDVKPHNLMLCVHGGQFDVLKVLDFGLVKVMDKTHTRDLTQYAKVLGTPLYMAPERLRNPADADVRADIYALGAVAFFLLRGRRVFEAETEHDLVYQVLNLAPPALAVVGAPPELETLVAQCLSKDRSARPASIAEVERVLAEVARQAPWSEAQARAWWESRGTELGIEWQEQTPA